jgi:hypothetical protein
VAIACILLCSVGAPGLAYFAATVSCPCKIFTTLIVSKV